VSAGEQKHPVERQRLLSIGTTPDGTRRETEMNTTAQTIAGKLILLVTLAALAAAAIMVGTVTFGSSAPVGRPMAGHCFHCGM
jgi:hypothetical protein